MSDCCVNFRMCLEPGKCIVRHGGCSVLLQRVTWLGKGSKKVQILRYVNNGPLLRENAGNCTF